MSFSIIIIWSLPRSASATIYFNIFFSLSLPFREIEGVETIMYLDINFFLCHWLIITIITWIWSEIVYFKKIYDFYLFFIFIFSWDKICYSHEFIYHWLPVLTKNELMFQHSKMEKPYKEQSSHPYKTNDMVLNL